MSYILDALKKADRDRQPVAVPTPATVHRTPAPPSRRRRLWPWIAGAVIVVNVGVWLWLLRPAPSVPAGALVNVTQERATSPAPAAPEHAARVRPVEPVVTPDALDKAAVAMVPSQAPPSATRSAPSAPLSRLEQNPDAAPRSASPPKPETAPEKFPAPAVTSAPVKPMERDPVTPPASQEPPVPQEVFANLHLQVHVYSEVPAERRVFINNQKYVEGQRIDANLVIESITSDGVFVSYRGKRVLLRADQSTSR
ncbi:general secretion pathway protein GspB [Candidatus Methylomirabilis sp.]|uniref:general secretion pathway protein GspB n=1 Tax=Candidatus Methylomirabilis sp. TaxID=2032687 RepID=UPI002A6712F9|nr:general secretion pathway protein GspB [Candidatus Methylomirabilis sp.]